MTRKEDAERDGEAGSDETNKKGTEARRHQGKFARRRCDGGGSLEKVAPRFGQTGRQEGRPNQIPIKSREGARGGVLGRPRNQWWG